METNTFQPLLLVLDFVRFSHLKIFSVKWTLWRNVAELNNVYDKPRGALLPSSA